MTQGGGGGDSGTRAKGGTRDDESDKSGASPDASRVFETRPIMRDNDHFDCDVKHPFLKSGTR